MPINPSWPVDGHDIDVWGAELLTGLNTVVTAINSSVVHGEIIFNVKDYGAVGDGVTDDKTAINAAITAAGAAAAFAPTVVLLPYTASGYLHSTSITLPSGVSLRGDRKVLLKKTGSSVASFVATASSAVGNRIENLTIDTNSLATSGAVNIGTNASFFTISNCTVQDLTLTGTWLVRIGTGQTDIVIEDCLLRGSGQPIDFVSSTAQRVHIRRNRIIDWSVRGIYCAGVGGSSIGVQDVTIEHNRIDYTLTGNRSLAPQPVAFQMSGGNYWHQRVKFNHNTSIGPGTGAQDTTTTGTADQFSFHYVDTLEVIGNMSAYGGDSGIVVSLGCRNVVVAGNLCAYNDTWGLYFGSSGAPNGSNGAVTGNTLVNNGQNFGGFHTGSPPTYSAGLRLAFATNVAVSGNILVDDQGSPTQQYGITFGGTNINLNIGVNTYSGNVTAVWGNDTGVSNTNVGIGFYGAAPVAKAASPGVAAGTDAAVINAIITALRNLGLVT